MKGIESVFSYRQNVSDLDCYSEEAKANFGSEGIKESI